MIRDPSDGSVKKQEETSKVRAPMAGYTDLKAKHGENWGLKSLDRAPRKPKPAPTAEELREHYAKHGLGFMPKES